MNVVTCYVIFLVFLAAYGLPEITSKGNKIKIVVPHKISYVHHHHHPRPKLSDMKLKMKYFYEPQLDFNEYDEEGEEQEEEILNESRIRHYLQDGESDGTMRREVAYYARHMPRFSSSASDFYNKPVFLYNNKAKFRHPSTVAVVRYGDYDEREHYSEDYDYK